MANAREIQGRMKSIKDTMKITNAMYMVSSSKLQKARRDLKNTEPFFFMMQDGLAKILDVSPDAGTEFLIHALSAKAPKGAKAILLSRRIKALPVRITIISSKSRSKAPPWKRIICCLSSAKSAGIISEEKISQLILISDTRRKTPQ